MRDIGRRIFDIVRHGLQAIAHRPRARRVVDRAAEASACGTDYAADGTGDAADCCAELVIVSRRFSGW